MVFKNRDGRYVVKCYEFNGVIHYSEKTLLYYDIDFSPQGNLAREPILIRRFGKEKVVYPGNALCLHKMYKGKQGESSMQADTNMQAQGNDLDYGRRGMMQNMLHGNDQDHGTMQCQDEQSGGMNQGCAQCSGRGGECCYEQMRTRDENILQQNTHNHVGEPGVPSGHHDSSSDSDSHRHHGSHDDASGMQQPMQQMSMQQPMQHHDHHSNRHHGHHSMQQPMSMWGDPSRECTMCRSGEFSTLNYEPFDRHVIIHGWHRVDMESTGGSSTMSKLTSKLKGNH